MTPDDSLPVNGAAWRWAQPMTGVAPVASSAASAEAGAARAVLATAAAAQRELVWSMPLAPFAKTLLQHAKQDAA